MSRHAQYVRPRCPQCKRNYRGMLIGGHHRMGYSLRVVEMMAHTQGTRYLIRCRECNYSWWSRNPACEALLEARGG